MVRQQLQSRQRKSGDNPDTSPTAPQTEDAKKLQDELRPEAERRVKVGLILEALAAKEVKLSVEEVTRMIQAGGQDTLDDLRSRILADKALDFVYKHAMIQG